MTTTKLESLEKNKYARLMDERHMHPFLVKYLAEGMKVPSKTIYQERTSSGIKGQNKWVHPDIVAYKLNSLGWANELREITGEYQNPKISFLSFELKKEITIATLPEKYFQALSNSEWANEGYLVAETIDTKNNALMERMRELNASFGIGIIHLNIDNPKQSEILLPARKKENINAKMIQNLITINSDFDAFIKIANESMKANKYVYDNTDIVMTDEVAKAHLESSILAYKNKKTSVVIEEEEELSGELEEFFTVGNMTGKKPEGFQYKDEDEIQVGSWTELGRVAINRIAQNKDNMTEIIEAMIIEDNMNNRRRKIRFSKEDVQFKRPSNIVGTDYYVELHLSANDTVRLIKEVATKCKEDLSSFKARI